MYSTAARTFSTRVARMVRGSSVEPQISPHTLASDDVHGLPSLRHFTAFVSQRNDPLIPPGFGMALAFPVSIRKALAG